MIVAGSGSQDDQRKPEAALKEPRMIRKKPRRTPSRREFLGAVGLGAGVVALGGCNFLAGERRNSAAAGSRGAGPGRTVSYDLEAAFAELEAGGA